MFAGCLLFTLTSTTRSQGAACIPVLSLQTSLSNNENVHMNSSEILNPTKNYLHDFFQIFIIEEVRILCEWSQRPIFVAQRLALHQNGVEICQLSIGDIRIVLATSIDVVRRRTVLLKNTHILTLTHTQSHIWRQVRCL